MGLKLLDSREPPQFGALSAEPLVGLKLMLLRFVRQIVSNDIAIKLIRLNTAVSLHIESSNHRLFVSVCPK